MDRYMGEEMSNKLAAEIKKAQREVRTDAYQMSIGEIVSMYERGELLIDPEFQRLFRWDAGQKSKLIESILLGIPLPPIFVFETLDGSWELIDGLQRISTILEFMGLLKSADGKLQPPSVMESTKYLSALHNGVWEKSDYISELPIEEQVPLGKELNLSIRRARLGVEILKRPSDNKTKFDLFQRLNAGGTQANAQEVRNCIILMVDAGFFRKIRDAANTNAFRNVTAVNDDQVEKQRHMEFAVRFLVLTKIAYDGMLDVEEYIDEGIIELAEQGKKIAAYNLILKTFRLLNEVDGSNALRRYDGTKHVGKVGLVGFEVIAVGVAKNLVAISELDDPVEFVRQKIYSCWAEPQTHDFSSPGLRGTTRIQRTVPFGEQWFKP